jgi:sugar lactone lactonase YvrE
MVHISKCRPIVLLFGLVALASCGGSGSTTAPPVNTTPQPGHAYIYAGLGSAGYGAMGHSPSTTELYWPVDVGFSPQGDPCILDWNNHRVIGLNGSGHCKLIVGVADGDFGDPCPAAPQPCDSVVATNAKLNHPTGVAFDPATGDMILCAWHNSEMFRLDRTTGLMKRICGTGARSYNGDERTAVTATVDLPVCAVFNSAGELVFADQANMIIRMIDAGGIIHTIAGTPPVVVAGNLQYQFGFTGNEGPAISAKFSFDRGQVADPGSKICYDGAGNLYICDTRNHCVRFVDPVGIVHQFAGVGPYDINAEPTFSGDGGPATQAHLLFPRDVAADADGNIFIADTGNNVIRMVAPDGTITTVAGKPRPLGSSPLSPNQVIAEDGKPAKQINLTSPYGVDVDSKGRLWIADTNNNVIRIVYR